MRKTKIICTLGPTCDDPAIMRGLLENGMDCARMNFSHGSHEEHKIRLQLFRTIRDELGLNTPVLLDTKGPEIRTGDFAQPVTLVAGQDFTIRNEDVIGDEKQMSVSFKELHKDVEVGHSILIDDGLVELKINQIDDNGDIHCTVVNGGAVSSKKSINVPGVHVKLPFLSQRDIDDIHFAIDNDYDFIALSFVRDASDILSVRRILEENNAAHIELISKIENRKGLDNIDEIIRETDGVMIARGDMGVEIPVEEVPLAQKLIIRKCLDSYKVVITATQMLDSMIRNPRPTRAEASDVANAIFDGTTCTMLSGETANGKYPIEALKTMASIIKDAESIVHYWKRLQATPFESSTIMEAVSHATCTTAMSLNAAAIATVTKSGSTGRSISRFHPQCPIICATVDPRVNRQLRLYWGVYPYMAREVNSTDELFDLAVETVLKSGIASEGDTVVITGGVPVGISGTTNMLKAQMLGNILCTGKGLSEGIARGQALVVTNPLSLTPESCKNKIIIVRDADDHVLPLLRQAKGMVVEYNNYEEQCAIAGKTLGIPIIALAGGAMRLVQDKDDITIDGNRGLVKPSNPVKTKI